MQIGDIIYVTNGSWTNSPTSFTYQWQNSPDLAVWTNIAGAVNSAYRLQRSDVNTYIRCVVTAVNVYDSASAPSNWVGPLVDIGFVCQFSTADPQNATQTWHDISKDVMSFHIKRGKQRILDRFESGTMDLVLKNLNRDYDPTNVNGPYYPYLLPLRQIRFGFVLNGVTWWQFTGYVERWPQIWKGPTWAEVDLTCVDGFEIVTNHSLASAYAALTTALGGSNRDLTFTSVVIGYVGNSTTVAYVVSGTNTPLTVSVTGTAITVNVATSAGGAATSTAAAIMAAVNADVNASALVAATLAPGQDGSGVVTAMTATALSGGTFVQQLSGARVSAVFDYVNWAAADRNISPGVSDVQAVAIPADGSVHALDHIYACSVTENGPFFFDKQNRPTFIDRHTLATSPYTTPKATFIDYDGDFDTGIPYQGLQADWDKDLIYNDVRSTRTNGVVQIADDATSDGQYFTRSLSLSPLSISDAESLDLATVYLIRYKQPRLRFEPATFFPGSSDAFWGKLLPRELMDVVVVDRSPPGGGQPIHVQAAIIGIDIQGRPPVQSTVWKIQVDPTDGTPFFVLDDPVLGILDANYLGY